MEPLLVKAVGDVSHLWSTVLYPRGSNRWELNAEINYAQKLAKKTILNRPALPHAMGIGSSHALDAPLVQHIQSFFLHNCHAGRTSPFVKKSSIYSKKILLPSAKHLEERRVTECPPHPIPKGCWRSPWNCSANQCPPKNGEVLTGGAP